MTEPQKRPRRLVGFSTELYFSIQQTQSYASALHGLLPSTHTLHDHLDILIVPDFITLPLVARSLSGSRVMHGAQNCFYEDSGAFTGEVSPAMLKDIGCSFVELGHADRRGLFHESDDLTAKKAAAVVRNGMTPLVCVGERARGSVDDALGECRSQAEAVITAIPDEADLVLAYEPVWAVEQGVTVDAKRIVGVTKGLRELVGSRKGSTRILYGGTVEPGLFGRIMEGVDGLFLGKCAHDVSRFQEMLSEVARAR